MKPKKVTGIECGECAEFVRCEATDLVTKYECAECEELYDSEEDAKECCAE